MPNHDSRISSPRPIPGFLWPLLALLPAAPAAHLLGAGPLLVFFLSAFALVPPAYLIGEATMELAKRTSPNTGALLNATLGNIVEILVAFLALREGLVDLVKGSIVGSILSNNLLVLGIAMLAGGLRYPEQSYNQRSAGFQSSLLFIAVVGLTTPSALQLATGRPPSLLLSSGVAGILIFTYLIGLLFSLVTHRHHFAAREPDLTPPRMSLRTALLLLAGSVLLALVPGELLASTAGEASRALGWSEVFIGVVVVGVVGNATEAGAAIAAARRNQMDLSFAIATTSSTQIALFAAPLLVFAGLAIGTPLSLSFSIFQLATLASAAVLVNVIAADGVCNWWEGAQLVAVYAILAIGFAFV